MMRRRAWLPIAGALALAAGGCFDAVTRGTGGDGAAETGGSTSPGASGGGGGLDAGGRGGGAAGATGAGGAPIPGTGGAIVAGTGGAIVPGTGGRSGSGGAPVGTGGAPGTGGSRGACVFCEDWESNPLGAGIPFPWTRTGGSVGDWQITMDGTRVVTQAATTASTLRSLYATGAPGAPYSGAMTISARIKLIAAGAVGPVGAQLCVRYVDGSNSACLSLDPTGALFRIRTGGNTDEGGRATFTITADRWYSVRMTVDAANTLLTGSVDGISFSFATSVTPATGYPAITTQSIEASFDDIVVTRP
jgi:hypothetical protein